MIAPKPTLREVLAGRRHGHARRQPADDPADAEPAAPPVRARRGLGLVRWVRARPVERWPIVAGAGLYAAGWLAYAAHPPTAWLALGGMTAGAVTYLARVRRIGDEGAAARTALAVGGAGVWLAVTSQIPPTWGGSGALTWAYCAVYGCAYWIYRASAATRDKIAWRDQKTDWHRFAARAGIHGAHLLRVEDTRLGERSLVDVTGTGRRASTLASGRDLAERIAELHGLPPSRVTVAPDRIAGRLWINIRHRDPWARPIPHPTLDDDPEIRLPAVADVREPLIVGMDPDTGRPLTLTVWDEDGAVNTLIVAMQRSGKTVLLSDILERLTAAPNTFVVGINVSKAKEMHRWRRALGLAACGPQERPRALRILEQVNKAIEWRGTDRGDETVFIPRPGRPLIVVVIDEMDKALGVNDNLGMALRKQVGDLTSKGGSEGVCVILVGQRGTQSFIGSVDIRTQVRNYVFLQLAGNGEAAAAMGDAAVMLPDMASCGEGRKGVACVATLDGDHHVGRSFNLKELVDIDRVVDGRAPSELEPGLVEHLGEPFARLMASEPAADPRWMTARTAGEEPADAAETPPQPAGEDDAQQDATVARTAATNADTAAYLAQMPDLPEPTEQETAALAAAAERRRAEAAEEVEVPDEVRATLLRLLSDGTTVRQAAERLAAHGVPRMGVWRLLDRLRHEGVARMDGQGRGARWHLAGDGSGGEEDTDDGHAA